jgi:DMSO/TMAO reductase YedYZ molybdopterin-dependent catalytic subunit
MGPKLTTTSAMSHFPNVDKAHAAKRVGRRRFLLTALAVGGLAPRYLRTQLRSVRADTIFGLSSNPAISDEGVKGLVTSGTDFFVRNHFRTPVISEDKWSLEISGMVSKPLKLSYSDLLLASSARRPLTLECAGNPSGGGGVSTAVWSGLPLGELLQQAGLHAGATTVVFHGADSGDGEDVPPGTHFARGIPLEKAMDASTLLAYEMNGAPLPPDHGFPLRALVGGWYGMDSVKWLTRIEVLPEPFRGYFQQEHYVALRKNGERQPITRIRVNSKFLRPSNEEEIRVKEYRLEGVAWAGERTISKVELRFDTAGAWLPATLPAASKAMVWIPWNYEWHIPRPGSYTLEVRAVDDEGHTQPDVRDPDRKDAYELNTPHRISVNVRP